MFPAVGKERYGSSSYGTWPTNLEEALVYEPGYESLHSTFTLEWKIFLFPHKFFTIWNN
jgi:hypothetical protein